MDDKKKERPITSFFERKSIQAKMKILNRQIQSEMTVVNKHTALQKEVEAQRQILNLPLTT